MANTVDEFNKRRLRSSNITVTISISLVLFLVGLFGLILINAQKYSDYIKEQLVVEVYFQEYLDPREAKKADEYHQETYKLVSQNPAVKKARFITREEASVIARKQLGIDAEALFEEHIFPPSIEVTLKPEYIAPEKINGVIKQLSEVKGVSEVKNDSELTQKVYYNLNRILLWIVGFAVLFLIIAIILINSSIRLKIFSKRFIIKTMQLVGATKAFIRRPFIVTNIALGILSALLACLALSLCLFYLDKSWPEWGLLSNSSAFIWVFAALFAIGIFISWISTYFAAQRFLNLHTDELYY